MKLWCVVTIVFGNTLSTKCFPRAAEANCALRLQKFAEKNKQGSATRITFPVPKLTELTGVLLQRGPEIKAVMRLKISITEIARNGNIKPIHEVWWGSTTPAVGCRLGATRALPTASFLRSGQISVTWTSLVTSIRSAHPHQNMIA